jgi:hypothetical protein
MKTGTTEIVMSSVRVCPSEALMFVQNVEEIEKYACILR